MRLGDLDALKKAIDENAEDIFGIEDVIDYIDNAPTVDTDEIYKKGYHNGFFAAHGEPERPQGEIKKYKPLELDYNVQCAVENLRTAYWSNESKKVAKDFTEAEDIIISAICHHGYAVCKQPQGEWIIKPKENSQSAILICSKCNHFIPITIDKNFCPNCGAAMQNGGKEE